MVTGSLALNESPSEKEGKFSTYDLLSTSREPSMKVPPKRKGNIVDVFDGRVLDVPSMKVPPKRKGNEHVTLA